MHRFDQNKHTHNSSEGDHIVPYIEEYFGYFCVTDRDACVKDPNLHKVLQQYYSSLTEEDTDQIRKSLEKSLAESFLIQPDIPLELQHKAGVSSALEAVSMNNCPVLARISKHGYCLVNTNDGLFSIAQRAKNHADTVHQQLDGKCYNLSLLTQDSTARNIVSEHYDLSPEFFWQLQVELNVAHFGLFFEDKNKTVEEVASFLLQEANEQHYPVAMRHSGELLVVYPGQSVDGILASFELGKETRLIQQQTAIESLESDFESLDVTLEEELFPWLVRYQELQSDTIDTQYIAERFESAGYEANIPEGFYSRVWDPKDSSLFSYLDSMTRDEVVGIIISISFQEILDEGAPISATGLINYLRERDRSQ